MSERFYRAFEDRYRGSRDVIKARLAVYLPFLAPLTAPAAFQAAPAGPVEAPLAPLSALTAPAPAHERSPAPPVRPAALDLGCGRGEWLELLGEHGFAAHGVDLDAGMLAACVERGLDVELTDALSSLRARGDASVALVSAFHLVEHIAFDQVQELIAEALRVLQPGGLLILETPNPENLVVGASTFYLDPSHLRPLPAQLLEFTVAHHGYARQKVLRLQEAPVLHTDAAIGLITVLEGVSPDYAVIGQKAAPAATLAPFDAPFAANYGVALGGLAQRYETQLEQRRAEIHGILQRVEREAHAQASAQGASLDSLHRGVATVASGVESTVQQLDDANRAIRGLAQQHEQAHAGLGRQLADLAQRSANAEQRLLDGEARMAHGEQRLLDGETRITQSEQRLLDGEYRLANAEARLASAEQRAAHSDALLAQQQQRIIELLDSTSWRITAPLRLASHTLYRLRSAAREGRLGSGVTRRVKHHVKPLLLDLARAALRRPRVKRLARGVLAHFPSVQARLQRMLYQAAAAPPPPEAAAAPPPSPVTVSDLSPRALRMYDELQRAIQARNN